MKKVIFLLAALLISACSAFSQGCLPEGITFSSQEQIDNFLTDYPGCTYIEGNVVISGEDVSSLAGLSTITSIGGDFMIGYYESGGNDELTNLTGLDNLSIIGGSLQIINNQSLISLTGLEGLVHIGNSLGISNNGLTNLEGLNNLLTIGGGLFIAYDYCLVNLSGLSSLFSINGDLEIHSNYVLNSLTGLENLNGSSIDNLSIYGNESLSVCDVQSICSYLSSPKGVVNIYANTTGCDSPPEIAFQCGVRLNCLPYGNYYFFSQEQIDSFHNDYFECNYLNGDVLVEGNDIIDLDGLNGIAYIGNDLYLENNPLLSDLTGLSSIKYIGHKFDLYENPKLIGFNGLDSLKFIGNDFWIAHNNGLINFAGLVNLDSIGGVFNVGFNNSLKCFSGLESLYLINQGFAVNNNDALSHLEGLHNLDYIGGSLSVESNDSIVNLIGIDSLSYVGGFLRIRYNSLLANLERLENLSPDSMLGVILTDNTSLSECDVRVICEYLVNSSGYIEIVNNASGCNSQQEVEEACEHVSVNDPVTVKCLSIVPNPANSVITVGSPCPDGSLVSIFKASGEEMISTKSDENTTSINISNLPPGLYFVRLSNDKTVEVGKFVKQ